MAPDERGRAAGATPDDKHDNDAAHHSPREPPPPSVLDLGGGHVWCVGTAADFRAAAAWLHRNYPEHSDDPPRGHTGPIYAMSNYRVRQVLALGAMPERQLRFLIALATWMTDDTRTVRVSLDTLIEDTGKSHNTVRNARRELESADKLVSQRGDGRGHVTLWTVLCLPEKGTSEVGTLMPADKPRKGTNCGPERVPTEGAKGYQSERADQHEPDRGLNRLAKPSSSSLSPRAPASSAGEDYGERENDSGDFDDEDELDPDAVLLAEQVPDADWQDIEAAITDLQIRKHHGEIRTSVRAYLRACIANGDARSLVDDAAAERRRTEMQVARYGDPFGSPGSANGAPVVAGEVIRTDAGVQLTGIPETRTSVLPAETPKRLDPVRVNCPECGAKPLEYCRNPRGGYAAGGHAARREAAERAAAVTP